MPTSRLKRLGASDQFGVFAVHMSSEKRHKWLTQFKYPYSAKSRIFGRFGDPKDPQMCFELVADLKIDGFDFLASEVLAEGDLIAIEMSGGKVRSLEVLAPNLLGENPAFLNPEFDTGKSLKWSQFLEMVRDFFESRKFIEVRTPTLVKSPGLEPHLDPFETEWSVGSQKTNFYLPTSPEFHLKKMLSLGWKNIFELKDCFRNGEIGPHHQAEFLMLEWYRSFETLDAIIADVKDLFQEVASRFEIPPQDFVVTTMKDLFKKHLGFELTPTTKREELLGLALKINIATDPTDTWDDLFFKIFLEKIERSLGIDHPTIVKDYPPSQAALAKINGDGWGDRFEFYWKGVELANAFHELTDPREQRERFKKDQEQKVSLGKKLVPVDPEFLEALDYGLPPSAGIALGMDRLFMLLVGAHSLEGTRCFPMRG